MLRWMYKNRGRLGLCLVGALALILVACGTLRGVGRDLSGASVSARAAIFGDDPDAPPID